MEFAAPERSTPNRFASEFARILGFSICKNKTKQKFFLLSFFHQFSKIFLCVYLFFFSFFFSFFFIIITSIIIINFGRLPVGSNVFALIDLRRRAQFEAVDSSPSR